MHGLSARPAQSRSFQPLVKRELTPCAYEARRPLRSGKRDACHVAHARPVAAVMAQAEVTAEDELLLSLAPNGQEAELLTFIADEDLRNALLRKLLRAEAGIPVRVLVNRRMKESDSFTGVTLQELLKDGSYENATLCRGRSTELSFTLTCGKCPQLARIYKGDDIIDHLLQYFAKDLIRFEDQQVQAPLVAALACAQPHASSCGNAPTRLMLRIHHILCVLTTLAHVHCDGCLFHAGTRTAA